MPRNRLRRAPQILLRVGGAKRRGLADVQTLRHIPRQRIVRGGLVGDQVEVLAAAGQLRHDLGSVSQQSDRQSATFRGRRAHAPERVVERLRRLVEVPHLEPALDAARQHDLAVPIQRLAHGE